jgi:hypothetical protein
MNRFPVRSRYPGGSELRNSIVKFILPNEKEHPCENQFFKYLLRMQYFHSFECSFDLGTAYFTFIEKTNSWSVTVISTEARNNLFFFKGVLQSIHIAHHGITSIVHLS